MFEQAGTLRHSGYDVPSISLAPPTRSARPHVSDVLFQPNFREDLYVAGTSGLGAGFPTSSLQSNQIEVKKQFTRSRICKLQQQVGAELRSLSVTHLVLVFVPTQQAVMLPRYE